jgi:hypothetical protein
MTGGNHDGQDHLPPGGSKLAHDQLALLHGQTKYPAEAPLPADCVSQNPSVKCLGGSFGRVPRAECR